MQALLLLMRIAALVATTTAAAAVLRETTTTIINPAEHETETEHNRNLIVGGQVVDDNAPKYPWFVLPGTGSNICGGSLISRTGVILTAAHCLTGPNSWNSVRIGVVDTAGNPYVASPANERRDEYNVFQTAIHPLYDSATDPFQYDFALLRVITIPNDVADALVELDINANPSIPNNNNNNELIAMGLGATDSGASPSSIHDVTMPFVDDDACTAEWRASYNASTMVCGGVDNERRGICSGDSGGPVVIQDNGQFLQIGVSSFGSTSCETISVFARVSFASDWINEVACDWSRDDKFCRAGDTEPPVTNEPTAAPVDPPPTALPTRSPVDPPPPTTAPTVAATAPPTAAPTAQGVSPTNTPTTESPVASTPSPTTNKPTVSNDNTPDTNAPVPSTTSPATSAPTSLPSIADDSTAPTRAPTTFAPTAAPTNVVATTAPPQTETTVSPTSQSPTQTPTQSPETTNTDVPSSPTVDTTEVPSSPSMGTITEAPVDVFGNPANAADLTIMVQFDGFPDDLSFTLKSEALDGAVIYQGPDYTPRPYQVWNTTLSELEFGAYSLVVSDTGGDGLLNDASFEGRIELYLNGVLIRRVPGNFGAGFVTPFFVGTVDPTNPPVLPTPAPSSTESTRNYVSIQVQYDGYPNEVKWKIKSAGSPVYNGPNDYTPKPFERWSTRFGTIPAGRYKFIMNDKAGDGLVTGNYTGSVRITQQIGDSEILLRELSGSFERKLKKSFVVMES